MVKCRDCKFCQEQWLTALQGQGVYRFNYCERLVHDCKVVEPDCERICGEFQRRRRISGSR